MWKVIDLLLETKKLLLTRGILFLYLEYCPARAELDVTPRVITFEQELRSLTNCLIKAINNFG
jgi:hypothetical protein